MATTVDATCSECFTPQQIEISPRYRSIECEFCGHSVPMLEKREIAAIRSALRAERSKMFIALIILAVAAAFFAFYVFLNLGDPKVEILMGEGEPIEGVLLSRDDTSVTVLMASGEEQTFSFASFFEDEVKERREEKPYLSEEIAAAQVGAEKIRPRMPEAKASFVFIIAVLASLGAVVFSFIAGQDKVVAEF